MTSGDCLAQDGARGENREQNMKRNSRQRVIVFDVRVAPRARRHARPVLPGVDESRFDG